MPRKIKIGWRRHFWGTIRNTTSICPECRFNGKVNGLCPQCGRPMLSIGERWRIPKKHDDKGWKLMLKRLFPREKFPRDKTAVVIDKGTHEEFKACAHEYLDELKTNS